MVWSRCTKRWICMIFVTVSAVRAKETTLSLSSNDKRVPCDGRNTAWKMVAGALERMGIAAEVTIHIEKRLPVQGGMGAGSANAAAALIALETEPGARSFLMRTDWRWPRRWARDVPLFLIGGAVLGTGRGEVVGGGSGLSGDAMRSGDPQCGCLDANGIPGLGCAIRCAKRRCGG